MVRLNVCLPGGRLGWRKRERELRSITASEAISEDDDNDHDVISSVLKTGSSRSEEIARETREIFVAEGQVTTEAEPAAPSDEPPAVGDAPTAEPSFSYYFLRLIFCKYLTQALVAKTIFFLGM